MSNASTVQRWSEGAMERRSAPSLDVVPLEDRHIDSVMAIDALVYPKPWSRGIYRDAIVGGDRHHLVALSGKGRNATVVGHGGLMKVDTDGHVTTVAVDPQRQGQGIGRQLMLALVWASIQGGCDALTLEVRSSNRAALALYRRFGFAPVGVRPGYYGDNGEDALIMWVHDVDSDHYRNRIEALAAPPETLSASGAK